MGIFKRVMMSVLAIAISVTGLGVAAAPAQAASTDFITQWKPNAGGILGRIVLPLAPFGTFNFTVDYGDGSPIVTVTSPSDPDATHFYADPNETYTVTISGTLNGWEFTTTTLESKNLVNVQQWGNFNPRNPTAGNAAFVNASNMTVTATDAPNLTGVTNLNNFFRGTKANPDVSNWDVSGVTNMSAMFSQSPFTGTGIENWNVSSATNMQNMFTNSPQFNGDVSGWNTGNVTNMSNMFANATSFNQNLSAWNTSKVTTMAGMFNGATAFTGEGGLGAWDTSNVTSMNFMFGASAFDGDLSNWDTAKVTNMGQMFISNKEFRGVGISNWNVSNVTTMASMFAATDKFSADLSGWDTSKVTAFNSTFSSALGMSESSILSVLNWNRSAGTTFTSMLSGQIVTQATKDAFQNAGWPATAYQNLIVPAAPAAPSVATATDITGSSIRLTWSVPTSPGSAIIKYIVSDGTNTYDVLAPTTTYTFTGLAEATAYTLSVKAVNASGTGPERTATATTLTATVPSAPVVSVGTVGATSVALSWPAPFDGGSPITGYRITGGPVTLDLGPNELSKVVSGLTPSTAYTFAVRAINAKGLSANGSASATTAAPSAPLAPVVTVVTNGLDAVVSWVVTDDGGSPVTGFEFTDPDGTVISLSASTFSYSLSGLADGVPVTVKVAAVNASGTGAEASDSFTPAVTVPAVPTISDVVSLDTSITLNWSAPSDGGSPITGYVVSIDGVETVLDASARSFTWSDLLPGVEYTVSVRAVNGLGDGAAVSLVVTTGVSPEPKPVPVKSEVPANVTYSVVQVDGMCPAGWSMGGWEEWAQAPVCNLTSVYNTGSKSWSFGDYEQVLASLKSFVGGTVAPSVEPSVDPVVVPVPSDVVVVKLSVGGRVVAGDASELYGKGALFTVVSVGKVDRDTVRAAKALAKKFDGVFGGVVQGSGWSKPRVVAAFMR